MNVKWTAPFCDGSGYGQAARNSILALDKVGVGLNTKIVEFSTDDSRDLGKGEQLAINKKDNQLPFDIAISEVTPNFFFKERTLDKFNIGFMFWEVVGIDPMWTWNCNLMDEIWTSSYEHGTVLRTFGVKAPITIIPVPMEFTDPEPMKIEDAEGVRFYSVFQWTERKNPKGLITSFVKTFAGHDDVCLMLKTYRAGYSEMEKGCIKDELARFIEESGVKKPPKIKLFLEQMSDEEMMSFHKAGDIFISMHRGEGWGMPQMEAMSVGNPIISTNWGGIHHWLSNKDSWLIPFDFQNVFGMAHIPWYNSDQLWASPNTSLFEKALLEAYSDPNLVKLKGERAKKLVRENFSLEAVGKLMKKRLEEIKV